MTGRWREENYFRYARAHFALDALDSYAAAPDDPDRMVPEPGEEDRGRRRQDRQESPRRRRDRPGSASSPRCAAPPPAPPPSSPTRCSPGWTPPSTPPAASSKTAQADAKAVPAKIPLSQHNPDMVRLDTETKLITHAIRMAAYNAETILARTLNGHYARAGDEAYALIREALTASGDIIPGDGTLTIRLDPLSAPRRTHALAAPLRPAQRHRHPLPRHPAHPALRDQEPPRHCINDLLCQESVCPERNVMTM